MPFLTQISNRSAIINQFPMQNDSDNASKNGEQREDLQCLQRHREDWDPPTRKIDLQALAFAFTMFWTKMSSQKALTTQ